MAESNGKKPSPPYVSYSSFNSFIKGLGETHVPSRIDKTVMSNYSGSTVYALLPALQWLGLIDEHGSPQPMLHKLANANDDDYGARVNEILKDKYYFLFADGFDLSKASSGQVIEAFKSQDISGSTVTKSISFFLAIAKAAGVNVSSHVKAPPVKRKPSSRSKKSPAVSKAEENGVTPKLPPQTGTPEGMEKISFSLRDKPDAVIYFPKDLDENEARQIINATIFNLKMYYGLSDG